MGKPYYVKFETPEDLVSPIMAKAAKKKRMQKVAKLVKKQGAQSRTKSAPRNTKAKENMKVRGKVSVSLSLCVCVHGCLYVCACVCVYVS